jgi:hypothetical protein
VVDLQEVCFLILLKHKQDWIHHQNLQEDQMLEEKLGLHLHRLHHQLMLLLKKTEFEPGFPVNGDDGDGVSFPDPPAPTVTG